MRVRKFRWSTDVFLPAAFLLVSVWGVVGGSAQVAFLAGALFVVQTSFVLSRIELVQSDGSYKAIISEARPRWIDHAGIIFAVLAASTVGAVSVFLLGLSVYLAIAAGGGLAGGLFVIATFARAIRRRHLE